MSGINRINHKNTITINLATSKINDYAHVISAARNLSHSCYHRYGSTVEFYIPDLYVERFVNNASNDGLDIII